MAIKVLTSWPDNTADEFTYTDKENITRTIKWDWNDWIVGSPITREKLENLEEGIAILATQMKAILGEIGTTTFSNLLDNSSRLDDIQSWITGSSSTEYDKTVDSTNSIMSRLTDIETEVWDSNTTSRIDKNDNKIAAIAAELGGTTPDGNSTTYGGITRLDDLEKEIGGTRSSGNGYTNSRIDDLEAEIGGTRSNNGSGYSNSKIDTLIQEIWKSSATTGISRIAKNENKIAAIANELGGTGPNDDSTHNYEGTTRLDKVESKAKALATEVWGTNIEPTGGEITVTSRLDDLETEICGNIVTRSSDGTGYINSRIDDLETEIGGTRSNDGTGYTGSRIDKLTIELYDSNVTDYNNAISRLDDLETEVCGDTISRTTNGTGYNNSRISAIETLNNEQNTRLDGIETLNIEQNGRLDNIESVNSEQDIKLTTAEINIENADARLNTLEETTSTHTTNIVDLQTKMGDGIVNPHNNISEAIRKLLRKVEELDPTGSIEILDNIVTEIWGEDGIDTSEESYINILKTKTTTLETNVNNLATEKEELKQNLTATNAKIPIEMYVATNSSADDTLIINASPRDKSIFFIAIPQGTLGQENLKLQTSDMQFVDEIGQLNYITLKKNYVDPVKVKYPQNSIISIYRKDEKDLNNDITSSNAYIVNMPMVL